MKETLEVEIDNQLIPFIGKLIIEYKTLFHGAPPRGISVSPMDFLKVGLELESIQRLPSYNSTNGIKIDDVEIFIKPRGIPSVVIDLKHAKQFAWMQSKDDPRIAGLV